MTDEALPFQAPDELSDAYAFSETERRGAAHLVPKRGHERANLAAHRKLRYQTQWHIPSFAGFAEARGRRVLEIGCGNGADAVMFAMHGARYVGVDVTQKAVDATRRHLALEGLEGRCELGNVERLGYPDESFDIVYSYGVLHHTRAPERAMHEVWRVLKPGAVALVMLHHRQSFNHFGRVLLYRRARLLLEILRRHGRDTVDRLVKPTLNGHRGNAAAGAWDVHYENFRREGWRYFRADALVRHRGDGRDGPCAFAFSRRDVGQLFRRFTTLRTRVAHLELCTHPLGRLVPRAVERALGDVLGQQMLIRAVK